MNCLRLSIRFIIFSVLLMTVTFAVNFLINRVYGFLLDYYSLPKSDSNITLLAFLISLVFIGLLTYVIGFWKGCKIAH